MSYKQVASDIIRRWCYPMVPDNDIAGLRMCSYGRNDIYVHPSVKLDYSTRLIRRCRMNRP